jgi:hypothetical protein
MEGNVLILEQIITQSVMMTMMTLILARPHDLCQTNAIYILYITE